MRLLAVLLAIAPGFVLADAPQFRAHPEYETRFATVKTVGIVTPMVKVFELTAGNNRVLRPDWSDQAVANVATALEAALASRGLTAKRLVPTEATQAELAEVELLFDAVLGAAIQATYANRFPAKVERFDYSVGNLEALLNAHGVDAVAFAFGMANISSGGRKAVQVLSGVVGGSFSYGIDRLFLAVADRSGSVLWLETFASSGYDLRSAESAGRFVEHCATELRTVAR